MSCLKASGATIAIAASFTIEPLLAPLEFVLKEVGLEQQVRLAPHYQLFQELLSPTSLLGRNERGGVDVVLVRLEDFVRKVNDLEDALDAIKRTGAELIEALATHLKRAMVPTLLAVMPPSSILPVALLTGIEAANAALVESTRDTPGMVVLSPDELQVKSEESGYDILGGELAHLPYCEEAYASLALAVARNCHALLVPPHKVLVLDCDETLWRGVLGEVGVDGIRLSPGALRLQQFAVEMQKRGVLICLVSKNSERDVLEAFNKRAGMILKLEHVVAYRINWRGKPQNVVSLAEELNVGLDAFVFMDDSPVECALIQAELPQARYVPEALSSANVLLVRARNGSGDDTPYRDVYNTGTFGWSDIADRLTVVDVDGGHYTMLEEPFVDSLARALSPYLQRNAPSSVRQLEVT